MRIDEYLDAYESYRDTVLTFEKVFKNRLKGEEKVTQTSGNAVVGEMIEYVDYDELKREYERKKRILTRATKRLQRAISNISDVKLSNYLVCRYLCCMTNESIADSFQYCERQIYRIASRAKQRLYENLLQEMPTARRFKKKRFRRKREKERRSMRKYGPKARKKTR